MSGAAWCCLVLSGADVQKLWGRAGAGPPRLLLGDWRSLMLFGAAVGCAASSQWR